MPYPDNDNHRRNSDHALEAIEEKIIALIEKTEDTKDKAFLLILMKLNDSITNNTVNTNKVAIKLKEMSTTFETHIKADEALLNRGKGWRDVLVWVVGVAQAISIYMFLTFTAELETIHKELAVQKIELTSHTAAEIGLPTLTKVK